MSSDQKLHLASHTATDPWSNQREGSAKERIANEVNDVDGKEIKIKKMCIL